MTAVATPPAAEAQQRAHDTPAQSDLVQLPPRHSDEGARGRRYESLAIFFLFAAAFGALGYWVVSVLHVVPFDALDRLTRALMVWHNDPPKLAAIGFAFPPLTTVVLLPFVVFSAGASSLVALPVGSAIFAGITMVGLNRALDRAEVGRLRYGLLVLVAVNPIVAFAASTGGGDIVGIAFATIAVAALVGWYATVDTRYLVSGGMAFALATVASYGFIPWWLLGAALVGVTLSRHRASDDEIEGSLILFLAPGVFILGVWILFNAVVVGEPVFWLTDAASTTVNAASSGAIPADLGAVLSQTGELVLLGAPLALLVLPALVVCAAVQRNELAAWLAVFLLVAIATPAGLALARDDLAQIDLQDALPIFVISLIGVMWLHQSLLQARALVLALAAVGLVISIPVAWRALDVYPYQSMEQAFRAGLSTREDQEGTMSRGGLEVGVLSERAMAEFLGGDRGRVLTDNAQSFGVIALTGRPSQFLDRADGGDAAWRRAAARPPADVKYFLFAKNASGDELRSMYPLAARGEDPRFLTVYDTPRYRLVAVPTDLGRVDAVRAGDLPTPPTTSGSPATP
ncbi:MAG: hypothetical protein JHD16_12735 [Solirubrobacteraceae bacterium]|nr:hypothetical protein [Solirubrobacteraceae bacterium]